MGTPGVKIQGTKCFDGNGALPARLPAEITSGAVSSCRRGGNAGVQNIRDVSFLRPASTPAGMEKTMKGIFNLATVLLACLSLLRPVQTAGAVEVTPEMVDFVKKMAEAGDAEMQCVLAEMYSDGKGVRQNYVEARRWYEKAAAQGYVEAQNNLGVLYNHGRGVRQNYTEAHRWYEKAAMQGCVEAQYNLGVLYIQGQGVRQDKRMAKEWFGRSCDRGFQRGCDAYRKMNEFGY